MARIIADRRITNKTIDGNLERIKANVEDFYLYFSKNYKSFQSQRRFVFVTSLTDDDINLGIELKRPTLEFNILEPFVSRQCGEFAKQEPSFEVREADDSKGLEPGLIDIIEGHMRHVLFDSNRDNMQYEIFRDTASGGFSAFEVTTEYAHEMSFNQDIKIKRVFDPTLTGFDKMAQESHKGDGMYCFKIFPMAREEFEAKYGPELTAGMKFTRTRSNSANFKDFSWSYSTANNDIILIAEYYEKKKTSAKIVQTLEGKTMLKKDYDRDMKAWAEDPSSFLQPAAIVDERETEFVDICRYLVVENGILEYAETDFKYLPIVFVDGNSITLRKSNTGASEQVTRSMVYHAMGIQRLKNFAGNTLANELENMVMHKFTASLEGIPEEYKDAYINVQQPSMLVYRQYDDEGRQLNPPEPIPRVPCPPEVTAAFTMSDQMTQSILGSYDGAAGITNDQISGRAMENGAMQSNTTAMPQIVNYMRAWNQAALIVADLLPKKILTPRKIPVRGLDGKSDYAQVNSAGSPKIANYDPNSLSIKVEAGVNFQIQQSRAFQTLLKLMEVNPVFAQFMMKKQGLMSLLDNIDIRGIDALKEGIDQFSDEMAQQQAQASKMQQQEMGMKVQEQTLRIAQLNKEIQSDPGALKNAEIQLKGAEFEHKVEDDQIKNQLKAAEVEINNKQADTDRLEVLAKIGQMADDSELERDELMAKQAQTAVSAVNAMTNAADVGHKHAMDVLNRHHSNLIEHRKISVSEAKANEAKSKPKKDDKK